MIFTNYKLPELYSIFADDESYKKYIDDLFAVSREYIGRAVALSALHTEAFIQSMKKKEEFDPASTMSQMFDCMSETDQKRFCESMFQKKGFFVDVYKMMMDILESAVEKGEGIENGEVSKKVEK